MVTICGATLGGQLLGLGSILLAAVLVVSASGHQQQQQAGSSAAAGQATSAGAAKGPDSANAPGALLEAELNSMVEQHHDNEDPENNKQLAEAIISRLMLDQLTPQTTGGSWRPLDEEAAGDLAGAQLSEAADELAASAEQQQQQQQQSAPAPSARQPESLRLKKLLGLLQSYEQTVAAQSQGLNGGQALFQYPELPASQAATMKRAAMRMVAQQQQQRHLSPYARNSFDFGLGKRMELGAGRRFGDSMEAGGQVQPVSQFIYKRPSGHNARYDFGLGKRVASPYPRYDFGLGKRAPNRIRYDFGLGRR